MQKSKNFSNNTDQCCWSVLLTLNPFFSKKLPLFSLKPSSLERAIFSLQIHVLKGYPHRRDFGEKKCQSFDKNRKFQNLISQNFGGQGYPFWTWICEEKSEVYGHAGLSSRLARPEEIFRKKGQTIPIYTTGRYCWLIFFAQKKKSNNTDQCCRSVLLIRFLPKSAPKQTHISSKRAWLSSLDFSASIYGHFDYSCLTKYGEKWFWNLKILRFLEIFVIFLLIFFV